MDPDFGTRWSSPGVASVGQRTGRHLPPSRRGKHRRLGRSAKTRVTLVLLRPESSSAALNVISHSDLRHRFRFRHRVGVSL